MPPFLLLWDIHHVRRLGMLDCAPRHFHPFEQGMERASQANVLLPADKVDVNTPVLDGDRVHLAEPDFPPGHGCAPQAPHVTMIRRGERAVSIEGKPQGRGA